MSKHIHIVCPEVPNPASPSDMTDTYFQLQFLQDAGYKIELHCFHLAPDPNTAALEPFVADLKLYPRNQGHKGISMRHPYCLSSRSNVSLLKNIEQHKFPILFQGTSTTYHLPELAAKGHKTFVRLNGIASELYQTSQKCEKSLLKKMYSFNEARLIKKWEEKISEYAVFISSTTADQQKLRDRYKGSRIKYVAPFIPAPEAGALPGTGMYCLYFGDMSNPDNGRMAHWLSENIFSRLQVPLLVVDTCSHAREVDPSHPESNICTVCNPAGPKLKEIIQKAQIVLLPRMHNNGFDKRLIDALEKGRYCLCNDMMVAGTGLESMFIIANDNEEIMQAITQYFSKPFTHYDITEREHLLATRYFPQESLHELISIIEN